MPGDLLEFIENEREQSIRDLVNTLNADSRVHAYFPAGKLPVLIGKIWDGIRLLVRHFEKNRLDINVTYFLEDSKYFKTNMLGLQIILQTIKSKIKSHFYSEKVTISELKHLDDLIDRTFNELQNQFLSHCLPTPDMKKNKGKSQDDGGLSSRLNIFYNAFQNSTDGVLITDLKGNIIEVNDAFLNIFGYNYDEAIGKNTSILRSVKTADSFYKKMWNEINKKGNWKGEILNQHKSGKEIPVLLSITPIYEREKLVGYMAIEIDMRRQKELEKRIIQSERLAIIGQMAAKVAHEVRNPLSSISLNAELLEDEIKAAGDAISGEGETLLKAIMGEVERVANLTEDYLQFSRLPQGEFQLVDCVDLIHDVLNLIEPEASSKGIQVVREIKKDITKIGIDSQQIRRVIFNLVRNAFEAMKNGGVLRIQCSLTGDHVEIVVSDTGEGIPEGRQEKIFEPFFTTKDMGTGLGLAISRQIVQEHGGRLYFRSKPRIGTTFTLTLPIHHKTLTQKEEAIA